MSSDKDLDLIFSELSISKPKKKILYYSLKIDEDLSKLPLFKTDNIVEHFNEEKFNFNKEFHITVLYTGGKSNENSLILDDLLDKTYNIHVDRIAISKNYVTFGVCLIQNENNLLDIPYFGNEIKHITLAITKDKDAKGKNYKPVNSPSAFSEGHVINFDEHLIFKSILKTVTC